MPKVQPFENHTLRYDNWFIRNPIIYQSEVLAVDAQIPRNRQGIEIGIGTGRFAVPLDIHCGLDPSKKMLKLAKQRGLDTIEGIAEHLPFHEACFNFALMVTTICFLDSVSAAFHEIYRILKPSGHFLVGFIDKHSALGKRYQQNNTSNVFYDIATFYSVDEVILYLEEAGFRIFHVSQTIFHDLIDVKNIEPIKPGYGEGAFVVIDAKK